MPEPTRAAIGHLLRAIGLEPTGGETACLQLERDRQLQLEAGQTLCLRLLLPCPAWELADIGARALAQQDARVAGSAAFHVSAVGDHLVMSAEAAGAQLEVPALLALAERLVACGDSYRP